MAPRPRRPPPRLSARQPQRSHQTGVARKLESPTVEPRDGGDHGEAKSAARPGARCASLDDAARSVIEAAGFGPGYATPGLPHRTGHGIGLDVHEAPYIVRGDETPLAEGMTFSIEPMICVYGAFGVRLEDHVFMTADGPRWFTPPAPCLDAPFGA